MRFLKKNFILIFLFIASCATGVLALSTALRLREFRSPTPQETSALTPQCKITFTIYDTTPREVAVKPETTLFVSPTAQISLIAQKPSLTPTTIITTTPLPTTFAPTNTPKLTPTPTAKQQTIGAPQTTISPTPTTKTTPTPTKAPAPDLPVSGTDIPTIGAFLLGFLFLIFGVFIKPVQLEVDSEQKRKRK